MFKHDKLKDALQYSYKLLARRPYSERRLTEKLLKRGIDYSTASQVVKHLKENRYFNDQEFAAHWVDIHINRNGWGPYKLKYGLEQQGIDQAIIDAVLADSFPNQDVQKNVCLHVLKKYLKTHKLTPENRRKKVFNYLRQHGFSTSVIIECMNQYADTESIF